MSMWDSISDLASNTFNSAKDAVSNTSLASITDAITKAHGADLPTLTTAAGNAIGNLTPAQIAQGLQPTTPQPRPAANIPTSTQAGIKLAGMGIGTIAIIGLAAYLVLGD